MARDTANFVVNNAGPAMVIAAVGAVVEHEFHVVEYMQDHFAHRSMPGGLFAEHNRAGQVVPIEAPLAQSSLQSGDLPDPFIHRAPEIPTNLRVVGAALSAPGPLHPGDLQPPEAPWATVPPPPAPETGVLDRFHNDMVVGAAGAVGGAVGQVLIPIPVVGGVIGSVVGAAIGFAWNEIF